MKSLIARTLGSARTGFLTTASLQNGTIFFVAFSGSILLIWTIHFPAPKKEVEVKLVLQQAIEEKRLPPFCSEFVGKTLGISMVEIIEMSHFLPSGRLFSPLDLHFHGHECGKEVETERYVSQPDSHHRCLRVIKRFRKFENSKIRIVVLSSGLSCTAMHVH